MYRTINDTVPMYLTKHPSWATINIFLTVYCYIYIEW